MTISSSAKTLVAVTITIIGSALSGQSAEAASLQHIDNLAVRLQSQARQLICEFRLHYRHTCDYRHLMSDSYQMYRLAAHIHSVAHYRGSLYHIRSDVNKLDRLFHHLEGLVDHIEYHPHGGHIHGHTGHVHQMLARMEDTLHHLQEDVRAMTDPFHGHVFSPVVINPGFGGHPGHGHGHSRGGISFGNDRFAIRFRF